MNKKDLIFIALTTVCVYALISVLQNGISKGAYYKTVEWPDTIPSFTFIMKQNNKNDTSNYTHTLIGNQAEFEFKTGVQNVAIGWEAMIDTTLKNTGISKCGNIIMGNGAGKYLTTESYCVIIGHDSLAINAKGNDLIWIVDWDEPYLCEKPSVKTILLQYYNDFIKTKKDDRSNRAAMVSRVINTLQ